MAADEVVAMTGSDRTDEPRDDRTDEPQDERADEPRDERADEPQDERADGRAGRRGVREEERDQRRALRDEERDQRRGVREEERDRRQGGGHAGGPDIPTSLAAAWGLHERPAKGPRPGLSLDRIVTAAITVADRDGLPAVSMARVAAELGSSPMSLYRYVGAKDELLALMVDVAMGSPPPAPGPDPDWRDALTHWAGTAMDAYQRAPWIVRVPMSSPPLTPNQILWMEAGLRSLRSTGLTEQEKLSTILLISGLARHHASMAADFTDGATRGDARHPTAGYARILARLADPERFPAVHAALASGSLADDDEDFTPNELRFGLERILDGIEVLITRRTGTESGTETETENGNGGGGPTD